MEKLITVMTLFTVLFMNNSAFAYSTLYKCKDTSRNVFLISLDYESTESQQMIVLRGIVNRNEYYTTMETAPGKDQCLDEGQSCVAQGAIGSSKNYIQINTNDKVKVSGGVCMGCMDNGSGKLTPFTCEPTSW
jgi:hypothetical protein